jgi:O-antigen ligase
MGLLLLTGGYNLWQVLQTPALAHNSYYEALLAAKIALFVICFALAIVLFRGHAGITIKPAIATGFAVTGLLVLLVSGMLNLAHIGILAHQ